MTTKTTRWILDTCGCIIEFTWDDTLSEANRVHTYSRYENRCSSHSALTGTTLYNTCLEENQRKNIALQVALANGPSTLYNTSGSTRTLKDTVTYNFSWSGTAPNRVLTISFTGVSLTTTQKNTIRTAENNRFGTGRVVVL